MAKPGMGKADDPRQSTDQIRRDQVRRLEEHRAFLEKMSSLTHFHDAPVFVFFKFMTKLNILQLQNEISKTQMDIFDIKDSNKDEAAYMERLEDQLHRYSKFFFPRAHLKRHSSSLK